MNFINISNRIKIEHFDIVASCTFCCQHLERIKYFFPCDKIKKTYFVSHLGIMWTSKNTSHLQWYTLLLILEEYISSDAIILAIYLYDICCSRNKNVNQGYGYDMTGINKTTYKNTNSWVDYLSSNNVEENPNSEYDARIGWAPSMVGQSAGAGS